MDVSEEVFLRRVIEGSETLSGLTEPSLNP
jgi:hypothetical protein